MHRLDKWANALIFFAAGLTATTGALGMAGWHLDIPVLYQFSPGLSPMQYNTALGMLLCGLAFLLHAAGARTASSLAGFLVATGAALILAQYVLAMDLGIDHLSSFALRTVRETHPGRMSIHSAGSFLLIGCVLALAHPRLRIPRWHAASGIAGAAVLTLGATVLIGYMSGLEFVFDWTASNRMAICTAIGFMALGICAVTRAIQQGGSPVYGRWVAVAASVSMFLISLYVWRGLEEHEVRRIQERTSDHARLIDVNVHDNLWHQLAASQRLASRLSSVGRFEREVWQEDAARYLADFPVLKAAALLDDNGRIIAILPDNSETRRRVAALAAQPADYQSAANGDEVDLPYRFVPPVRHLSPTLIGVGMPCEIATDQAGVFFSVADLEQMFRELQTQRQGDFTWGVYFGNEPLCCFPAHAASDFSENPFVYSRGLELMGSAWELRLAPTEEYLALQRSPALDLVLYGGAILALGICALILLAQTAAKRSLRLALLNQSLSEEMAARNQAQQDLKDLNAELEQRVSHRTQQLEAVNKTLREFTQIASHDLQEPLRKQQMFTGVLAESLGENLEGDAGMALNAIVSASHRMRSLVEDLLAYSRSGNHPIKLEVISLRQCVDNACDTLAMRIGETGADILCDELPGVWGDETLLTQIFQNLIGNALKFRRPDVPPRVKIEAETKDAFHVIRVCDNGIGIDPKFAAYVFGAFKRLHTRNEIEGTGIGLSICQNAIVRLGGTIYVDSDPGAGSTFTFTLPVNPSASAEGAV